MTSGRLNAANVITLSRIVACPAIFLLALSDGLWARMAAFVLFLAAALSDLWDGYLARKHGMITDMGKLLDPVADKLLLVATFVPFYMISHRPGPAGEVPWWGDLPLWVVIVIFGRELAVTMFRSFAVRRGVVISAGKSGKYKAFVQNLFIGGLLLWWPLRDLAGLRGWDGMPWDAWAFIHRAWVGIMLAAALFLTVYSMAVYLWEYRAVLSRRG